jgi:hypothetical protein
MRSGGAREILVIIDYLFSEKPIFTGIISFAWFKCIEASLPAVGF